MEFEQQLLDELTDMAQRQMETSEQQATMQATLNAILSELRKPAPPSTLLGEIAGLLRDLLNKLDDLPGSSLSK